MPQPIARFAPTRSDRLPANSSNEANSSVYASITHCRPDVVPPSSRPIVVRATFTIRMSRVMRKKPSEASRSVSLAAPRDTLVVGTSAFFGTVTVRSSRPGPAPGMP